MCCIINLHTKALSEEQTDVFFHSKSSTVAYTFNWLNMLYILMWQSMINYTIHNSQRNLGSWHQTWCYMSWNLISEYTKTSEYTKVIHKFHTQPCRWFCGTFFVMFGHFWQSYFNGWMQVAWTLWRRFSFSTHFLILFLLVDHIVLPKNVFLSQRLHVVLSVCFFIVGLL